MWFHVTASSSACISCRLRLRRSPPFDGYRVNVSPALPRFASQRLQAPLLSRLLCRLRPRRLVPPIAPTLLHALKREIASVISVPLNCDVRYCTGALSSTKGIFIPSLLLQIYCAHKPRQHAHAFVSSFSVRQLSCKKRPPKRLPRTLPTIQIAQAFGRSFHFVVYAGDHCHFAYISLQGFHTSASHTHPSKSLYDTFV